MIQHAELIVSVSVPRPFDLKRTGRLTAVGVAQAIVMQRYSPLNASMALKGALVVKKEIVEFNPPRG